MFPIVKCRTCKHYHPKAIWKDESPIVTCDAFPDGIPVKIYSQQVSHDTTYEGDHGIHYEPAHPDAEKKQ
ncbi:hypothetical protein [Acidaminococcus timonensis]|uniref:hypothetical protein n=1 Tax=Acidaminococcus timonensis TaxID=1871002 RepID=UPI0026EC5ECA|nr:hypothetical protein [Acidaminococcus timonensis]